MSRVMGRYLIKPLMLFGVMAFALPQSECWGQAPAPGVFPRTSPLSPPPPLVASPGISLFRQLLSVKPEEREKLLAGKTADQRRVIEGSVHQYESLSSEEREIRLRTMELRYQLTSLLRVAPGNRAERLKLVPEMDRQLVEERLEFWDKLSPEDQKEAMESERIIRIISITGSRASSRDASLSNQTSNQVRRIEEQLVRWQSLPAARREQVQRNFTNLFELTDAEKARQRLQPLPLNDAERALMQNTLDRFKQLSPTQRALCVRNFEKFAELSPAERREFLASAQEWQKMKPEDREAWRKLVGKVHPLPPLPPGYRQPPLPPGLRPQRNVSTAQNTN